MSNAVDIAQKWVREMINRESRGPGDRVNAMRRISERNRLSYNLLWSLLYRPPNDLMVSVYERLGAVYENELRRAVTALDQERKLYESKCRISKNLVRVSDFIAGKTDR